jgi:hypothetical protein
MPQLSPENYVKVTAIVNHGVIKLALLDAYPELSHKGQEEMMIEILTLMARRCGCEVRRFVFEEHDDGE